MEPKTIKKLDENVINRIAAGEIIQRPANALKEMLENSIDANATNIQLVVKEGGLKLLQIADNGTGIRKEDFDIVCERFTTSKLEKFEDLNSIKTYGFRGEALASISHVAHLTIQSKIVSQDFAYKASFVDSKLKEPPRPCAGNQGTIIMVEDLFYNMPTRRKVLRNATEEYRKIFEVFGRYAIHNASVSFSLKKFDDSVSIKTPSNSNPIDNIRIIFGDGNVIAKELVPIEYENDSYKFSVSGYVTNVNYSAKKGTFILFINHRLVDSTALKRSIDHIYSTYLPKNSYSFVYLSLEIDPKNVDVNVHPTKHEVHFLHEEQIIEHITKFLESELLKTNNSKVFYTQTKLPGFETVPNKENKSNKENSDKSISDKNLVRTDSANQKIDKFIKAVTNESFKILTQQQLPSNRKETRLTSVLTIRQEIEKNCHETLKSVFNEHVFVGCVSLEQAIIQHNTRLYLCNTRAIMRELFYQLIVYNFENFSTISFVNSNNLSIKKLTKLALDLPETGWTEEDGDKDELTEQVQRILIDKLKLLDEYFSLKIDSNGLLLTIPLLIDNYMPEMSRLPQYILRLASEVNWLEEQKCFETFARETASYYSYRDENNIIENANTKWTIEHILYPAVKKYLLPPKSFTENTTLLHIANVPDLYKVFERC